MFWPTYLALAAFICLVAAAFAGRVSQTVFNWALAAILMAAVIGLFLLPRN